MKFDDHTECGPYIRAFFEREGIDATVSTCPPIVTNPYTQGVTCPHGTTFWAEPTGEQLAQWHRDGVK